MAGLVSQVVGPAKILLWRNDSPGKDKEANRLPAPNGEFRIVFRNYGPGRKIKTWKMPPLEESKCLLGREEFSG